MKHARIIASAFIIAALLTLGLSAPVRAESAGSTENTESTGSTENTESTESTGARSDQPVIAEGIWLGDQSLGGMTAEEAKDFMNEYMEGLADQEFSLVFSNPARKGSTIPAETTTQDQNAPAVAWSYQVKLSDFGVSWDLDETIENASHVGQSGRLIERYKMLMDLKHDRLELPISYDYDEEAIRTFLTGIAAELDRASVDATIKAVSSGVFEVTDEKNGRTVNVEKTLNRVCAILDESLTGQLELYGVIELEETEKTGEQLRKVKDWLGHMRTNFTWNSPRGRNIYKASEMINGTVLWPGESFAVDAFLRPYTTALGWEKAPTYVAGRVVDDVGGGVCQIASTLYNAVLYAELQVDQRHPHSMLVTYVDPSRDATLATGSKDFVFTNNLDAPIYIEGRIDNKLGLVFIIWGHETRPSNRTIEFESRDDETKYSGVFHREMTDQYTFDPTLNFFDLTEKQRLYRGSHHDDVRSQLWKIVKVDGKVVEETRINWDRYTGDVAYYHIGTKDLAVDAEGYPLKLDGTRQMKGMEYDNNYVFLKDVVLDENGALVRGKNGCLFKRVDYLVLDKNGDPLTDSAGHFVLKQEIELENKKKLSEESEYFYLLSELQKDSKGNPIKKNGLFVPIPKVFTITWVVNGKKTTSTCEEGKTPSFSGSTDKPSDVQYDYTFDGWDPQLAPAAKDTTYTAKYKKTVRSYTITWVTGGTTTTETYEYDKMPSFKGSTDREPDAQYTYTFTGWSPAIVKVAGDATYTAQYSTAVNTYTVTWNVDGTVTTETYEYGKTPSFKGSTDKASDAEHTYTFAGWSPEIAKVTGDATYTARYETAAVLYTVTWIVGDTTTTENYEYNATPSYKGSTDRPQEGATAYTFTGWSPAIVPVTANATYTAQYDTSTATYQVTWVVGSSTTTETYEYGQTPSFKGSTDRDPDQQYTYTFTGWSPAIAAVTGNATYTAQYSAAVRSYTVTWVVDGNVTTETYEYGQTPSFKGSTDKASDGEYEYTFAGWDSELTAVTGDVTYTAVYTQTPVAPPEPPTDPATDPEPSGENP